MRTAQDYGAPLRIVETVVDINDERKKAHGRPDRRGLRRRVDGKTIAVLGLTFKPNTDDMRDSPSLDIIPALSGRGRA